MSELNRDRCLSMEFSAGRPRKILSRSLTERSMRPNSSGNEKTQPSQSFDYRLVELYVKKSETPFSRTNLLRPSSRTVGAAHGRKTSDDQNSSITINDPGAYVGPLARTRISEDCSLCRVLEFLYISGLDAAFDTQRLCRQNIEWIVNASNMERQGAPQSVRTNCPCICKAPTKHARNELAIHVNERTSPGALVNCFEEVNRFITSARTNRKQVLVFSTDGRNSAQALAVQYIMFYHKVTYKKARAFLESNLGHELGMADNFEQALLIWETQLQQKSATGDEKVLSDTVMVQQKPGTKSAW